MTTKWRDKHNAEIAKRKKLEQEYDAELRKVEISLRRLADQVLGEGKYHGVSRSRAGEFLSDAAHLVRRMLNHEDRDRR